MMSMLIPGPKSPGNSIGVYLQPPIDELIYGLMVLQHGMRRRIKISLCVQFYYGLLMIFQHTGCYLDEAQKASLLVHTAIRILIICG
jgi:hypothetical protein